MPKTKNANSVLISKPLEDKIVEMYMAGFLRKQISSVLRLPYYIIIRTINHLDPELTKNKKALLDNEFFIKYNLSFDNL